MYQRAFLFSVPTFTESEKNQLYTLIFLQIRHKHLFSESFIRLQTFNFYHFQFSLLLIRSVNKTTRFSANFKLISTQILFRKIMTLPYSILCSSQIFVGTYRGSGYRMRLCFEGVQFFEKNQHHLDISKKYFIVFRAKI